MFHLGSWQSGHHLKFCVPAAVSLRQDVVASLSRIGSTECKSSDSPLPFLEMKLDAAMLIINGTMLDDLGDCLPKWLVKIGVSYHLQ